MEYVMPRKATSGSTARNGVFYAVCMDRNVIQHLKNCWKRCFLLGLLRGCIADPLRCSNISTVALRVAGGDGKGTQCLGV
jgi:hypothetical protein